MTRMPSRFSPCAPLVLVFLLVASGCVAKLEGGSTAPPSAGKVVRLSDARACDFTSPDGQQVACVDVATKLVPGPNPSLGEGWVCFDHGGGSPSKVRILLWYHPVRDELAVEIQTAEYAGSRVVAHFENQNPTSIHRWNLTSADGTVRIPSPPIRDALFMLIYKTWLENESAQLKGAVLDQVWARVENRPYPLQRIDAPGGPYFFSAVIRTVDDETNRTVDFDILPATFRGVDFGFSLRYERVASAGFVYNVEVVTPSC